MVCLWSQQLITRLLCLTLILMIVKVFSCVSDVSFINCFSLLRHNFSLQARKFGVRAAMPGFIARKLCPQLIFVPTDFKKYTYYSDLTRKGCGFLHSLFNVKWIIFFSKFPNALFSFFLFYSLVFQKYDPNFLAASLDEAYLDITNYCNDKGMTAAEVWYRVN